MGHPGLLLDGGVVPGAAPRACGLQLEHGRLAGLGSLGGRPVEAGLEGGGRGQLLAVVGPRLRSLRRGFGRLVDAQAAALRHGRGRGGLGGGEGVGLTNKRSRRSGMEYPCKMKNINVKKYCSCVRICLFDSMCIELIRYLGKTSCPQ